MSIILKILIGVVGLLIAMFCFNIFWGMISCGLPCTSVLIKCGALRNKGKIIILARDIFNTMINFAICIGGLLCVIFLFREALVFYIVGAVIGWFFGGSKDPLIPNQARKFIAGTASFLTPVSVFPPLKFGLKRSLIYEVVQDTLPDLQEKQSVSKQSAHNFLYTYSQIQAYTQRYNSGFLILKDFNDGEFRNISLESNQLLVDYIFNAIPLCMGWCIFHANQEKKQKAITEAVRFLDDLENNAPEELKGNMIAMKSVYASLGDRMLKYKKENIDPRYLEDSSKENYNILIADFLKYICKIYPKIKWYDGIIEDFKKCMDE